MPYPFRTLPLPLSFLFVLSVAAACLPIKRNAESEAASTLVPVDPIGTAEAGVREIAREIAASPAIQTECGRPQLISLTLDLGEFRSDPPDQPPYPHVNRTVDIAYQAAPVHMTVQECRSAMLPQFVAARLEREIQRVKSACGTCSDLTLNIAGHSGPNANKDGLNLECAIGNIAASRLLATYMGSLQRNGCDNAKVFFSSCKSAYVRNDIPVGFPGVVVAGAPEQCDSTGDNITAWLPYICRACRRPHSRLSLTAAEYTACFTLNSTLYQFGLASEDYRHCVEANVCRPGAYSGWPLPPMYPPQARADAGETPLFHCPPDRGRSGFARP